MTRLIDADQIQYTMLYKENWMTGTGMEAQGVWKEEIDKMPTVNAIPLKEKICKCSRGDYILYNRKWLYEHLRQEFNILAEVSGKAEPVKHGHWITYPYSLEYDFTCSEDDVVCSVCEKQVELIALSRKKLYKYCPYCGARMDEVKEE